MLIRFSLYSVFKNLRFFEAFFVLYLLAPTAQGGAALSFFQVGIFTGYQKLLTALLEVPLGFVADGWGRRRSVALCFSCYALAFPLYALSIRMDSSRVVILLVAQTLFGIGEAFRTGTHKAIMLDWVDHTPDAPGATTVIGTTRFWSKLSAGLSAVVGGVVLWQTKTFVWLFLGATIPAVLGVALALSYPARLDGAYAGRGKSPRVSWKTRLRDLKGMPGMGILLAQSILFESHIKVAQHYIQPLLQAGMEARRTVVVGGIGAVMIGTYYLAQDSVGAIAAWFSARAERLCGDRSLTIMHVSASVVLAGVSFSLFRNVVPAVVFGFLLLAILQNTRRPIFVSRLNEVMDKPQGAATLSVESQSRSLSYAVLAPATGWLADHFGLPWAMAALALTGLSLLGSAGHTGTDRGL